jgi:hypothetical protein
LGGKPPGQPLPILLSLHCTCPRSWAWATGAEGREGISRGKKIEKNMNRLSFGMSNHKINYKLYIYMYIYVRMYISLPYVMERLVFLSQRNKMEKAS